MSLNVAYNVNSRQRSGKESRPLFTQKVVFNKLAASWLHKLGSKSEMEEEEEMEPCLATDGRNRTAIPGLTFVGANVEWDGNGGEIGVESSTGPTHSPGARRLVWTAAGGFEFLLSAGNPPAGLGWEWEWVLSGLPKGKQGCWLSSSGHSRSSLLPPMPAF
jgi:hypothetical protein